MGSLTTCSRRRKIDSSSGIVRNLDSETVDGTASEESRSVRESILFLGEFARSRKKGRLLISILQVDAGGFRDSSVTHTFSGLSKVADRIFATVPMDTVILSSILPFENGLDYVNSAKGTAAMDRSDRIQGGFYGGQSEGIDWWAQETMRNVIKQGLLQR